MKIIGKTILTSLVLALIVWIASLIFSFPFIEWSVFIGLVLTVVLLFFNSSGGTPLANFEAAESGGMSFVQKEEEPKFNVGIIFYGSALFTIVSILLNIFT